MSKIIITEQNFSIFSKRLKKSISKQLGIAVSLNQAKKLIAEMTGSNSIHQLQENLKKEMEIEKENQRLQDELSAQIIYLPNPENLTIISVGKDKRYLKYAVVSDSFVERVGFPYYAEDIYFRSVNLFGEAALLFNKFEDAKKHVLAPQNAGLMILEYALPAYSHQEHMMPVCENYWSLKNGELTLFTH